MKDFLGDNLKYKEIPSKAQEKDPKHHHIRDFAVLHPPFVFLIYNPTILEPPARKITAWWRVSLISATISNLNPSCTKLELDGVMTTILIGNPRQIVVEPTDVKTLCLPALFLQDLISL